MALEFPNSNRTQSPKPDSMDMQRDSDKQASAAPAAVAPATSEGTAPAANPAAPLVDLSFSDAAPEGTAPAANPAPAKPKARSAARKVLGVAAIAGMVAGLAAAARRYDLANKLPTFKQVGSGIASMFNSGVSLASRYMPAKPTASFASVSNFVSSNARIAASLPVAYQAGIGLAVVATGVVAYKAAKSYQAKKKARAATAVPAPVAAAAPVAKAASSARATALVGSMYNSVRSAAARASAYASSAAVKAGSYMPTIRRPGPAKK